MLRVLALQCCTLGQRFPSPHPVVVSTPYLGRHRLPARAGNRRN